jgi:hypothetical protein
VQWRQSDGVLGVQIKSLFPFFFLGVFNFLFEKLYSCLNFIFYFFNKDLFKGLNSVTTSIQ